MTRKVDDLACGTLSIAATRPRSGRPRDDALDAGILDAVIEILARTGYERMTMAMVAELARAGKATVYRRWPSKAEMVLDAVARMKRGQVDLDRLPDTGSLRGDLLGLFKPYSADEAETRLRAMAGLASVLSQHPGLAAAGTAAMEPWIEANRRLMRRAAERGEVRADADIETAATLIPSMAVYRALMQRLPFDRDYLETLVDRLVLPAICC